VGLCSLAEKRLIIKSSPKMLDLVDFFICVSRETHIDRFVVK
jgi:hypothetical protein